MQKLTTTEQLTFMLSSKPKSVRRCIKCNTLSELHAHHVTYTPAVVVDLCKLCHNRITGLNTKGSLVAHGNKLTNTAYTNKLRLVLWKWFLTNPWPDKRRISKTEVRSILSQSHFHIEPRRSTLTSHCCKANKLDMTDRSASRLSLTTLGCPSKAGREAALHSTNTV